MDISLFLPSRPVTNPHPKSVISGQCSGSSSTTVPRSGSISLCVLATLLNRYGSHRDIEKRTDLRVTSWIRERVFGALVPLNRNESKTHCLFLDYPAKPVNPVAPCSLYHCSPGPPCLTLGPQKENQFDVRVKVKVGRKWETYVAGGGVVGHVEVCNTKHTSTQLVREPSSMC